MSAIYMRCEHCHEVFVTGVVGSTPWPKHVCPDGTENAPAEFYSDWSPRESDAKEPA